MDQQIPYYPQNMHGFCFDYHHCSYDRHYCHYTSMKMSTYDTSFHHVFKQCQSKWEGVHGIIYMTMLLLAICRSSASWYFKALDLWCIMWYVSKPQPTHIQCTKPASTWIKSCNRIPPRCGSHSWQTSLLMLLSCDANLAGIFIRKLLLA